VDVLTKENEISAAPKVLTDIDLKDKVVTGDAMFTQRDLSAQIVEAGGHYLWTVKDNQPTLRADIERLFGPEHVPLGSAPLRTDFQSVTTTTKGHGRLEIRELVATTELNEFLAGKWTGVAQVFRLTRPVTEDGQTHTEVVYGLSSLSPKQASAARLLELVRDHWAIENRLHWRRDVTLREDHCQVRKGQAPRVLAVLNSFLLALMDFLSVSNVPQQMRSFEAHPLQAVRLLLGSLLTFE